MLIYRCKQLAYNLPMQRTEIQDEPLVTKRLKELIEKKRVSKADLARVASVSPQSVNGWFKRGSISKEAAAKISNEYGVSLTWLLGESDQDGELRPDEIRLLEVFNRLPPTERSNMLAAFEMRLQELVAFYSKYVNPAPPDENK